MAMKGQTPLTLVALLSIIAAGALSISHQVNTLSYLEQEYSSTESQLSELMKDWEILALERWMLRDLGTYPRSTSLLLLLSRYLLLPTNTNIGALVFYSKYVPEENLTLKYDPLAEILNITVAYLELANQTNLNMLNEICMRKLIPQHLEIYLFLLNREKIIFLKSEQVTEEVLSKCVRYLSLSMSET